MWTHSETMAQLKSEWYYRDSVGNENNKQQKQNNVLKEHCTFQF